MFATSRALSNTVGGVHGLFTSRAMRKPPLGGEGVFTSRALSIAGGRGGFLYKQGNKNSKECSCMLGSTFSYVAMKGAMQSMEPNPVRSRTNRMSALAGHFQ